MEEVSILEEVAIKCGDCSTLLGKLIATKLTGSNKPLTCRYKIEQCPKCNGSSFMTKDVTGNNFIWPANELWKFDTVSTEVKNGVIINILKIIGAKK